MQRFVVPGCPVSWMVQTKRLGQFLRPVTHDRTISWQARVAAVAQQAGVRPVEGPVELRAVFRFAWPTSKWKKKSPRGPAWRDSKPDLTNLTKALEDALKGIAWKDDAQVARHFTEKRLVAQGRDECVLVEIVPLGAIRSCRKCGCSDDEACPDGPCGWVDTDLCSACVAKDAR